MSGQQSAHISWSKEAEPKNDSYVVYWSSLAHRAEENPALCHAIERANALDNPLLVVASLTLFGSEITKRQIDFALSGIEELKQKVEDMGAGFVLVASADDGLPKTLIDSASAIVTDFGYLQHHKKQRQWLANNYDGEAVSIESMVCVPVDEVSDKAEYAARTIRPKIEDKLEDWLHRTQPSQLSKTWSGESLIKGDDLDIESCSTKCNAADVSPVDWIEGGYEEASKRLTDFLRNNLKNYADKRSDVLADVTTKLSPYLRFGHISPREIVRKAKDAKADASELIEELVVRRELSANFCHFTDNYDQISALPDWASETLDDHKDDERDPKYGATRLDQADTDDEIWNAAMQQMKEQGWLHNHLRMYWGKQIALWMRSPKTAHKTALELNNRYFIDGGDPNSYVGVLWLFGLHDQAFQEREIIGKVRPMTEQALKRKFDTEKYLEEN